MRNPLAPPHGERNNKNERYLPEPSTKQTTSSVPVIDPIASSLKARDFREAAQNGNIDTVWSILYGGDDELKKYCAKHLISLGNSRLVELINSTVMIYTKS